MRNSIAPRLTVAFVVHSMDVGGAERSVARLINALDHRRFRPLVVCITRTGAAVNWIESPHVPVIELKKRTTWDRKALRRFSNVLVEYSVDVIHSHNWGTLLESSLARRWAATPGHVHAERGTVLGGVEMRGFRMRARGFVARWALRRCSAVVTNARAVAKRVGERCGYPESQVVVIANGVEGCANNVPLGWAATQRARLGIGPGAIVLGSVGRLVPVKGFELALQAVARLAERGGDFHLLLVGEGPEREELKRIAVNLGVPDRVHLVGHQERVTDWLSLMDIYLNTSYSEGMSQSLVEALAAGCPIIATDVGDSADVVGRNQECGYLVPAGDVHAIATAVAKLAAPAHRRAMGKKAADRHLREFSLAAMASQYESLYQSLVPSHSILQHVPNAPAVS